MGNVIDNACKWANTRVDVTARYVAEETLCIEVSDDGPGVTPDEAKAVLQRGARADPDTPGHGIGLAVVQQLVCEVYGGTLDLVPNEKRSGLTVRLTLHGHPGME